MALGLPGRARNGQFDGGRRYARARLIDDHHRPIAARDLVPGRSYLFHYPYVTTPCFLINLGQPVSAGRPLRTESGRSYRWAGGVGPQASIVAFAAICAHKLTHPARSVSFINYRPDPVSYANQAQQRVTGRDVIYCCSERSVYDVRDGARVLGGPATQPLTAIGLEYDAESDRLFATGTFGGELYAQYFARFRNRLQLEYRITEIDRAVGERTVVQPLEQFTRSRVLC